MDTLKKSYISLIKFGESLQSLFLLLVRLFWGFLFLQTGYGKINHIADISNYLQSLAIPFPEFMAHLLAWTEAIGGVCLILGFASRLISLPLIFSMTMAFLTAHFDAVKNFLEAPGAIVKESPFTYLLASLIILIFGPGIFSIDKVLELFGKSKIK